MLLAVSQNGSNMFTEAYRTLRTSMLLSSATHPPRTVVFTSHEAGVGKTTTAGNLAIALAQAGKHVLLLDADMRHPNCATMFDVDIETGLSTYLSFDDKPASIYHDCGVLGLDLLSSGPVPPNPSELLHSERVRLLLESVAKRYDHVIIDTPPLGLVSDALILSTLVDGVVLVVKPQATSRRGIRRVKNRLDAVNAKILGVVVNAVDMRRHQNGYYGYGYGSYYGHGPADKTPKPEQVTR
jgi:capsular exopolysaccharide synthesis family protein